MKSTEEHKYFKYSRTTNYCVYQYRPWSPTVGLVTLVRNLVILIDLLGIIY